MSDFCENLRLLGAPYSAENTECVPGLEDTKVMLMSPPRTSLSVGLPLKKSVFLLLFGG